MARQWEGPLEKVDEYRWRIPVTAVAGMRVPGLIYADEKMISDIRSDNTPEQVANVAQLPGIVHASLAMPDIHWGYGFCIGGVAATAGPDGVISPGGVGYDINCGVRLVRTNLSFADVKDRLRQLADHLFAKVPCGVGSKGSVKLSHSDEMDVLVQGARWAVRRGFGWPEDIDSTENHGAIEGADPEKVSERALERGGPQQGTLGAGNHFLEVQVVEEIFDTAAAQAFGLAKDQVTVMIHCGSRGLGHQVCDDYLKVMGRALARYGIKLPDRELACAPVSSPEGRDYFAAMTAAANYAWANRQVIMHYVRGVFEKVFGRSDRDLGMALVYDVAHNIAKFEEHEVDGKTMRLCVHRKGATRAFPPGHREVPEKYRATGQPVIIPGDMGRNSYVLVGTQRAMEETWGSTCHGAGRVLSRHAAIKMARGRSISEELERAGIIVRARGRETLAEEAPEAYKDVNAVVGVVEGAGISRRVAKLRPLAVVKG